MDLAGISVIGQAKQGVNSIVINKVQSGTLHKKHILLLTKFKLLKTLTINLKLSARPKRQRNYKKQNIKFRLNQKDKATLDFSSGAWTLLKKNAECSRVSLH